MYIGRGSIFGNQYEEGKDGDLDTVLRKYQIWFSSKLNNNEFRNEVEKLKGNGLGCFCRPKEGFQGRFLCHGQVIWSYLEGRPPEECP